MWQYWRAATRMDHGKTWTQNILLLKVYKKHNPLTVFTAVFNQGNGTKALKITKYSVIKYNRILYI